MTALASFFTILLNSCVGGGPKGACSLLTLLFYGHGAYLLGYIMILTVEPKAPDGRFLANLARTLPLCP